MTSEQKRELIAIQDMLLEQVRTISRLLETERLTAIGRRELLANLTFARERIERFSND